MQEGQAPEEEHNPWAHCMVMWGNLLYEASQMYAVGGAADWKDSLDAAVEKFRAAGCPEPDIQAALRNHTEAEKLDLPPVKASASLGNNERSLRPRPAFTITKAFWTTPSCQVQLQWGRIAGPYQQMSI